MDSDSLSPSERNTGTGSSNAVERGQSLQENIPPEQSSQKKSGEGSDGKNTEADSSSNLSVTAEPFKSTSFDQSPATQLSVFAKEFVPKAAPTSTAVYTETYNSYGV